MEMRAMPAPRRRAALRAAVSGALAVLAVFAGAAGGWCARAVDTAASGDERASGDVRVTDAWIRWLPAGLPAAGYFTLTNTGPTERVIIGASSADFGDVSLHRSRLENGVSGMEPVDALVLKPHTAVRFAEGGYHLMLLQPKRALHPDDSVTITLRLRDGAPVTAPFAIRAGG